MSDQFTVVCNVRKGRALSEGALAYLHVATATGDSVLVVVKSRGGRWIKIWQRRHNLTNFRVKTIPAEAKVSGAFKHDLYLTDSLVHAQINCGMWITLNWDAEQMARGL